MRDVVHWVMRCVQDVSWGLAISTSCSEILSVMYLIGGAPRFLVAFELMTLGASGNVWLGSIPPAIAKMAYGSI